MKVLVANLGSTSFKFRLFDMDGEEQLARGSVERIGSGQSRYQVEVGSHRSQGEAALRDHAQALELCLRELSHPEHGCLRSASDVAAIGFKAVHGGPYHGVHLVDEQVLAAMEEMAVVAPAHNPPYINAMRMLRQAFPGIPLVAAFEPNFHQTIPLRNRTYAVPYEWAEKYQVRRWGFHGASHRWIATRMTELLGPEHRVISCHLGGSSSLCAIRNGQSVANSLGMSPQTGVPHNNRVGDFDPFALPVLMKQTGKTLEALLEDLACRSGLLGLSGSSGDVRDLEAAAQQGNSRAQLALEVFVSAVRHYLGAYLVELGGADAVVFTGGIGENSRQVRRMVCQGLEELGLVIDPEANEQLAGEGTFHAATSRVQLWVVPANEELIVARQTRQLLEEQGHVRG